jgi:uncharacterized protein
MRTATCEIHGAPPAAHVGREPLRAVRELTEEDQADVLDLLTAHAVESVHLKGMVEDHGVRSAKHRGRFYGYFEGAALRGVALLGHAAMFCCGAQALPLFAAALAESGAECRLVFGPRAQVEAFFAHLCGYGYEARLARDMRWYVCREARLPVARLQLQQADVAHLAAVEEAQASLLLEATGADPRETDPEGFRERALERIERGRTWVKVEGGRVVFKAELQSITAEAIYLEGIWTHPEFRGRGIAKECVAELTHRRLRRQQAICLVVEPEEEVARHIYEEAGFADADEYRALYLKLTGH